MDQLIEKLTAISGKIAQNWVIHVIMNAFMMLLPITMLGSFAALFKGIGIEAYQSFIASIGAIPVLNTIYQWTTGMIGAYLAFLVAYAFAKHTKCAKSEMAVGLTSLACFLICTPYIIPEEPYAPSTLPTTWLGAQGMFSAIIISFVVGGIYLACKKGHIEIKLPEQVPPFISAQFSSLIPAAIAMVLFGVISQALPTAPSTSWSTRSSRSRCSPCPPTSSVTGSS